VCVCVFVRGTRIFASTFEQRGGPIVRVYICVCVCVLLKPGNCVCVCVCERHKGEDLTYFSRGEIRGKAREDLLCVCVCVCTFLVLESVRVYVCVC